MNLAVRGIDADIKWNNEGSFHKDELRDLRADFVLANPPFNISDWGGDRLREDVRWKYGPRQLAMQTLPGFSTSCITFRLAERPASCSLTARCHQHKTRRHIRRALIEGVGSSPGVVDCIVALPGQLFYSTPIPVCLWFFARDRSNGISRNAKLRDRRGEILFIDARALGHMVDRTRKEFSDADIDKITQAYHAWRGEADAGAYEDVPGFSKSATLQEISESGYVLTPARYVGAADVEEDDMPFAERFSILSEQLSAHSPKRRT